MAYLMQELQNEFSFRKAETLTAKTLTTAKIEATKKQLFQDTVLIVSESNNGTRLSLKKDGKWMDSKLM